MKSSLLAKISLLGMSVFLLSSCSLFRKKAEVTLDNIENMRQFKRAHELMLDSFQYEWLSSSGRIKFRSPDQSISASYSLKNRNDSVVWMRFLKLGFEGARLQISGQKFQMINRLQSNYVDQDIQELLPAIDASDGLPTLENMLYGQLPFPLENATFSREDNFYKISYRDTLQHEALINRYNLKLSSYKVVNEKTQSEATAHYQDYRRFEKSWLPTSITVKVDTRTDDILLQLIATSYSFSEQEKVEFEIPEGYEKL